MKVLTVYNAYLNRGGEDEVFEAEADLLEQNGHDVTRFRVEADKLAQPSLVTKARLASKALWSPYYYREFRRMVADQQPNIVHFHNTFPLISPSAYAACREKGAPVVHTLHNYRLLCPNVLFYRDGHPCEDCLGKSLPWPGVLHACYHDSRTETAVIATMLAAHRRRGTWERDIDRYIVLTEFARRKFIAGGLPSSKLVVKPNFVAHNTSPFSDQQSVKPFVFVGRLALQKGIATLLRAWELACPSSTLRIVGDGPMWKDVLGAATEMPSIIPLGRRSRAEALNEIGHATSLIFASEWYEGFPLTIAEAFSMGVPVLASRLGAGAEIVEDGRTGLHFTPGDAADLAAKVRWAWEHPAEMQRMGEQARREYERKYTPERNYTMLMDIYRQAIETARASENRSVPGSGASRPEAE